MVLPRQTPSWIMCTDGRLSACRLHEELLFKRPPYKYVRSSPTVLFMILARKRFRAFFYVFFGVLAFWRFGVLAFWRSGSGGAEKLCAVDVKKGLLNVMNKQRVLSKKLVARGVECYN